MLINQPRLKSICQYVLYICSQLFRQRVGVPKYSAAESYVMQKEPHLWEHMKKYRLEHIEDGIRGLK